MPANLIRHLINISIWKKLHSLKTSRCVYMSAWMQLTSSAGGHKAKSSGCLFPCRASRLERSSSSWLLKAVSPSTLWSGVKHRKLKSEGVSAWPESSLSPARVGDLIWGNNAKKRRGQGKQCVSKVVRAWYPKRSSTKKRKCRVRNMTWHQCPSALLKTPVRQASQPSLLCY